MTVIQHRYRQRDITLAVNSYCPTGITRQADCPLCLPPAGRHRIAGTVQLGRQCVLEAGNRCLRVHMTVIQHRYRQLGRLRTVQTDLTGTVTGQLQGKRFGQLVRRNRRLGLVQLVRQRLIQSGHRRRTVGVTIVHYRHRQLRRLGTVQTHLTGTVPAQL